MDLPKTITPRHLQIINLINEGLSTKEIAAKLFIADKTVKFHKTAIFKLLKCQNTAELYVKILSLRLNGDEHISAIKDESGWKLIKIDKPKVMTVPITIDRLINVKLP